MSLDLDLIYPDFNFTMGKSSKRRVYEFESFRLDGIHRMLYRDGEEVLLPPKAVETLRVLVERRGEILSKEELMHAIWTDAVVEESNLAKYLHILRRTLGIRQDGVPFIETFRRRGYRFNGEVHISESLPQAVAEINAGPESAALPAIKQHGNVLRFVDKRQPDAPALGVTQPQNTAEISPPRSVEKRRFPFIAVGVVVLLLLSLLYFRNSIIPAASTSTKAKNDLSILRLTNGVAPVDATISPKGDYFVYHEQDGEIAHLWLQQTGQSKRVEIVPPMKKVLAGKTFSPDGQYVYFVARDDSDAESELFRVPTLGGTASKVLEGINTAVSFSPDGGQMVFQRTNRQTLESSLVIANPTGAGERVLIAWTKEQGYLGTPAWSPDGSKIAFSQTAVGGVAIIAINLQSNTTEQLSPETWGNCYRIAWTRDGAGLVFIGTKANDGLTTRRDQVYFLSLASGESRRLTTDGNRYQIESLGVTETDEILVVPFDRSSQIWQMNPNGDARSAEQITRGAADGRAGLATLPDGRFAYTARVGDNISVWTGGKGEEPRQLTFDPPVVEEVRAAADGRFLVFSSETGGVPHLFRIDADGANLRQITFGTSYEVDSTISPDGNWVAFASQLSGVKYTKTLLQKIPATGGEPILLNDGTCTAPHFSPDGKFISCVFEDNKFAVVSAEDGSIMKTFEPVQTVYINCGAKWSSDGRDLIYIVRKKDVSNLWRQPIDGGKPQPLTDFTSGDMHNFAFSTDGSRLYLARGFEIRDVILIKDFR